MASNEQLLSTIEPFFGKPCAICSKEGTPEEATKTCLDCGHTLCSKCLRDHDKFDMMKGHRVLDRAISTDRVALPSRTCGHHGGKLIDMFCPQHDSVCCTSCIAIHHRRCEDIGYVPSISAGTKISPRLHTALQDLKDVLEELQQRKREREGDKKRLADERWHSERSVHEFVAKIIACINDLKEKSLNQIQHKFDEFQLRVDDHIDKIGDAIASLEKDIKSLEAPCDNDSELFVIMKQSIEHEKLASSLNSKTGSNLKKEALVFNVNHQIEDNMKQLESLGVLETPFLSAQALGRYKIGLKHDNQDYLISGICSMPDGSSLMTDNRNETLKRLDSSYNLVDHCKLPGRPFSICRTGPTEVVIALVEPPMVQFVSVSDTLSPTRSFRVGEACRGIAYSRGQIFIACGGYSKDKEGPGEVRVYTTGGQLLHNLPKRPATPQRWSCPYRISLSSNGNKMIVADQEHGIVTMNRDGSSVSVRRNRLAADSLCVQDQSLCFVCSSKTRSIYQVSSDGRSLGALLTEENGIDAEPWSVCYQKDGDRLIVGFRACEYIKVFQLHRK